MIDWFLYRAISYKLVMIKFDFERLNTADIPGYLWMDKLRGYIKKHPL